MVNKKIEEYLDRNGITLTHLAKKTGISKQNLSRILKGNDIKWSQISAITEALKINLFDLLSEEKEQESKALIGVIADLRWQQGVLKDELGLLLTDAIVEIVKQIRETEYRLDKSLQKKYPRKKDYTDFSLSKTDKPTAELIRKVLLDSPIGFCWRDTRLNAGDELFDVLLKKELFGDTLHKLDDPLRAHEAIKQKNRHKTTDQKTDQKEKKR